MKSPGAEWVLGIGYLAAIDIIRAKGDPDDDTISECLRAVVERHPQGQRMLAAALVVGGVGFYKHICDPLKVR